MGADANAWRSWRRLRLAAFPRGRNRDDVISGGGFMSRIREIKRQLEMASEAIEALDADLAAGRLGVEEHGRQRAEREREAGRLFVTLRRGQRETGGPREPPPPAPAGPRPAWFRSPLAMGAASVLLVFVGI